MIAKLAKRMVHLIMLMLMAISVQGATLSLTNPATIVEETSTTLNYSVTADAAFSGTINFLYTNINSSTNQITFSDSDFTGLFYNGTITITADNSGAYGIFTNLSNATTTLATTNHTGTVNSTIPYVKKALPSGLVSVDYATLFVQTNEPATCKFDTTNTTFDNMSTTFTNTGINFHNHSVTNLAQGTQTYYVRCQDAVGNIMQNSSILQFTIDLPPTAAVTLSDKTPVKEGTIEVTLTLSESVIDTPVLQYQYDDGTGAKTIALEGSGTSWKGFIIVTDIDNNKIGSFTFSATDSSNNKGTKITSGNIFIVDTEKPPQPTNMKTTVTSNGVVQVDWYYEGEDVSHFNVYRSISSGVSKIDFYETATNSSFRFTDSSTENQVTYYYRITAVDEAGNEGLLSDEIYATVVRGATTVVSTEDLAQEITTIRDETPRLLPPVLVEKVETYIKDVDKTILDFDAAVERLNGGTAQKKSLVEELGIISQIDRAKKDVENIKADLSALKNNFATESEIDGEIEKASAKIRQIEKFTPRDVTIKAETDFIQAISDNDVQLAVDQLFKNVGLTEKEIKAYVKANAREKDDVTVNTQLTVIDLHYLDGNTHQKSYISKNVVYAKEAEDLVLIEFIPKAVAESASDITFLTQGFEVLEDDPIIKFGFHQFSAEGEQIAYTVDKEVTIDQVKQVKSVLLPKLNAVANNEITGFALFGVGSSGESSPLLWIGLLIVVGLLIYYVFFVKEIGDIAKFVRRKMMVHKLQRRSSASRHHSPTFATNQPISNSMGDDSAKMMMHEFYHHMDKAKSEMTDKMLPVMMSLHSRIGQQVTTSQTPQDIVAQAHMHVAQSNKQAALQSYKQLMQVYSSLPKEAKPAIYAQCKEVHQRINQM